MLSFLLVGLNCYNQTKWFESSLLYLQVLQHICTLTCLVIHHLLRMPQSLLSLSYQEQM